MSARELAEIVADGRWDDFATLCDNTFFRMSLTCPAELQDTLETAPEEWIRRHPRQYYARAGLRAINKRFSVFETEPLEVFTAWVAEQDPVLTRDAVTLLIAQLQYRRFMGQFDEALQVARQIEQAIETSTDYVDFDDFVACMFFPIGATRLMTGDLAGGIAAFSSALRWSRHWRPHPAERHARNYLATTLALAGDYRAAAELVDPDEPVRQSDPGTLAFLYECGGAFGPALIALGAYDRTRTASALERLDDAARSDEFWWLGVHAQALWQLHWGEPQEAAALIERSLLTFRELAPAGSMARTLLVSDLADTYQALGLIDRAMNLLDQPDTAGDAPWTLMSRARLHNLTGNPRSALDLLGTDGVRTAFLPTPASWHLIRANAYHLLRNDERANEALGHAAAAITKLGDRLAVAECAAELRDRLAALVDDPPDTRTLYRHQRSAQLTRRELEVLLALRTKTSVRDISEQLFLSPNTIKTHLRNLYRKLGVNTREEALQATRKLEF
ncbi:LuxR C-terminal-related transcriptional regulator [Jiangella sp. DSM 45060]|uniref:LuxR C-terminal-related transcriptional regulator n=1 Tax=Jiangella sp. DSM 45060 TaxID=1798224 RepID=UPI00087A6094|nr:LuxR C-terminal-related transcriptional regulator [Jiangella sp. DSM 45060]SDT45432.1 regulatory protein, luxR family [Jiangella sp. DSM 45060]